MRGVRAVAIAAFVAVLSAAISAQTLVRDVRAAIAQNDFAAAEALVGQYRAASGTTPELLAGMSWLGRAALAAKDYDKAERYARDTEKLTLERLKTQSLASDPNLVTALGAFVGEGSGKKEIYASDLFLGEARKITSDRALVLSPRWSPDGSSLLLLRGAYG